MLVLWDDSLAKLPNVDYVVVQPSFQHPSRASLGDLLLNAVDARLIFLAHRLASPNNLLL